MAVIQSGQSTDLLGVDSTSKAARVTLYDPSGAVIQTLPVTLTGSSTALEVRFSNGQSVSLAPGATVALADGSTVALAANTSVGITGTPTVALPTGAAMASVKIEPGVAPLNVASHAVTVSNTPSVSVSNTPAVTTSSATSSMKVEPGTTALNVATHPVTISGTPAVTTSSTSSSVKVEPGTGNIPVAITGTPTVTTSSTTSSVKVEPGTGNIPVTISGTSPVSMTSASSSVKVEPGTGNIPVSIAGTNAVTTSSTTSSIKVEPGVGNIPVAVSGTPAVTTSSTTSSMKVEPGAGTHNVAITGTPTVGLAANTNVGITGTPTVITSSTTSSVKVEPGATALNVATHPVTISGTPAVTTSSTTSSVKVEPGAGNIPVAIAGTPAVTTSSTSSSVKVEPGAGNIPVAIAGTPAVTTNSSTSSVKVEPGTTPLSVATHAVTHSAASASTALSSPAMSALGVNVGVTGYGSLRATPEPTVLFQDPFDGTFDPIRWVTGGTVAPTVTGGRAQLEVTAANGSSSLVSNAVFQPTGVTFQGLGMLNRFELISTAVGSVGRLNSHRFFGVGTVPATWTTAYTASPTSGPMLNGYGFEIDVDGNLYAVIYDNGTRYRADAIGEAVGEKRLNLSRAIFNNDLHQFGIVHRPDAVFWYIDGQDAPAALYTYKTPGFPVPDQQTLPIRIHTLNGATAPSGTMQHRPAAVALADTGRNAMHISDGVYPWQRVAVTDVTTIPNSMRTAPREQWAGNALNVNTNAVQLATYKAVLKPTASALTANTVTPRAALYHLATATKTCRVRRIEVNALMSAVAQASVIEVHWMNTAPTAGSAVAQGTRSATGANAGLDPRDPAPECEARSNVSVTSQGLVCTGFLCAGPATVHGGGNIIYNWEENGMEKPITFRPGVLEGIIISIVSNAAVVPTLTVEITYTEE